MAGSTSAPTGGVYGVGGLTGCDICGVPPVFGVYQTPAAGNTPGGLKYPMQWSDKQGNLWLFSGFEYLIVNGKSNTPTLNALWEFNISTNQWAWMGGSNSQDGNVPGVYGTLGQPDAGNTPGGRSGAETWSDSSGHFWLFGGSGMDATGNSGALNDLWMFDPAILEWTWMGGSNLLPAQGGAPGVFGTLGTPAPGNTPNGLTFAFQWTDKNGDEWLIGGNASVPYSFEGKSLVEGNPLNDLWKFNSSSHEWAWMGGSSTISPYSVPGVYGTLGKPSPASIPGGRSTQSQVGYSWTDNSGNLWLYGGNGYDSTGNNAELNDLWEFNPSLNEWAWMGGPTTFTMAVGSDGKLHPCTPGSMKCAVPGVYGTMGTPAPGNNPGTRSDASQWTDKSGNIWLFGGWGVDSAGTWGYLNDLWEFSPSTDEWTWMGGISTVPSNGENSGGQYGVYGTLGTFSASNMLGGHQPAANWTDHNGNFWLFGGSGCNSNECSGEQNDLWEYELFAPSPPTPAFALGAAPTSVTVAAGSSGASTIATEVANGFDSTVTLAVSSQPAGISVSFNPASIVGVGTSTMTIAADSSAAYGAYPISVTGSSGSVVHTANIVLDVISPTPVATPTFTPAAGNFSSTQTVAMSDTTPGAIIHFTTDGSTPTINSTVYTDPITVTTSKTIEAYAVATNYPDSAVATASYTIVRAPVTPKYNPSSIAANGNPISLLLGDVNDDGLPDILYQDSTTTPATIQEALAQPDGSYIAGPALSLPKWVGGCRTLDANNDGKLDLACLDWIDEYDMQIATFLGNGDGTFQAPIYSAPMQSCEVCLNGFTGWLFSPADVNSDGIPDLLVGDLLDSWTFVLLGDGTGHFNVVSTVKGIDSYAEASIYVLDINGDGKPDIVSSTGPTVWLGNGKGAFQGPILSGNYSSCVLHDMDGDGIPDAVCGANLATGAISSGKATGATQLAILHGNGDGSFNPTPIATQTFGNPTGGYGKFLGPVAVNDLNGDGIPDILAYSPDGLTVLLGQPGLTFANPVHYATGYQAINGELSSFFADMNHDGLLDVVASGPNGIYFSYGKKDGTFAAPPAFEVADVVGHVTVADFNGDGIPDIAATGDQSIELSLGNGDGTFKPSVPLPDGGIDFSTGGMAGYAQIVHGDFNGDGQQDILAIGSSGASQYDSYILFGKGIGSFASPQLLPNSSVIFPNFARMAVLDINKDGRDDILTTDSSHIYSALSNGDGTFTTVSTSIPEISGGLNPSFPAFADFNHDGKVDAVYGQGSSVYVLKGHGDGTFDTTGTVLYIPTYRDQSPPSGQIAVTTGDFDGDGNADIAVLVQFELGAVPNPVFSSTASIAFVYYGNGDGTFSLPVIAGVFDRIYSGIYASDLNKDGLSDLVFQTNDMSGLLSAPTGDSVGVVMSLPGRAFGQEKPYNGGSFESDLAIADLNGDGYPDLLAVNSGFFPNGDFSTTPGNSVTELMSVGAPAAVNTLPTTSAVVSSNNSAAAGSSVTFTATVTNSTTAAGTPTGTVAFTDRTGISGTVPLVAESATTASATFSTSDIGVGPDVVNAVYSGDSVFAASSAQVSQTVTGYPASLTLTASPNSGIVGQSVAFTATVANPAGSTVANPVGYVEFSDSSSGSFGSNQLQNGAASASASLTVGVHTIAAWYSGDALHASSTVTTTEPMLFQPIVTLNAPHSILSNQDLSATILVSSGNNNPIPTGSVTLSGGGYTSPVTVLSNGSAAFDIPAGTLPLGADSLSVSYTPDAAGSSTFLSASMTGYLVSVTNPPPTFTISSTPVSVVAGATTGNTSAITITPAWGFTGNVALTAAEWTYPTGAVGLPTLSINPSNGVTITGRIAETATVTINTTAPTTSAVAKSKGVKLPWYATAGASLACILLFGIRGRRRRWQTIIGMLLLLAPFATSMLACGGGGTSGSGNGGPASNPGTTPGVYTVTITGAAGSIIQTNTISLTVK